MQGGVGGLQGRVGGRRLQDDLLDLLLETAVLVLKLDEFVPELVDVAHGPVTFEERGLEVFLEVVPFLDRVPQLFLHLRVALLELSHLLLFNFYLLVHVVKLKVKSSYIGVNNQLLYFLILVMYSWIFTLFYYCCCGSSPCFFYSSTLTL